MNQILATENKKNKKSRNVLDIQNIIRFFALVIMIYGLALSGEGCYAIYRDIEDRKPGNIPAVTIGRMNDQAIVNIEHSAQIMEISYSWDNGEENIIPVNGFSAQESITLLGYDSVLNLTVEDINGKKVTYQKQYLLNGVDITKPSIEIFAENGSDILKVTAKDETALEYFSYKWEDENENITYADSEGQKEIPKEINLVPGTRNIKLTAVDKNGNIEVIEKEIITSSSRPEIKVITNRDQMTVNIKDKDGIKEITINLNGQKYTASNINKKEVTAGPLTLREGNNIISVEVTNTSGYKQTGITEIAYNP